MRVKKLLNIFKNKPRAIILDIVDYKEPAKCIVLKSYSYYLDFKNCKVKDWDIEPLENGCDYDLHITIEKLK